MTGDWIKLFRGVKIFLKSFGQWRTERYEPPVADLSTVNTSAAVEVKVETRKLVLCLLVVLGCCVVSKILITTV